MKTIFAILVAMLTLTGMSCSSDTASSYSVVLSTQVPNLNGIISITTDKSTMTLNSANDYTRDGARESCCYNNGDSWHANISAQPRYQNCTLNYYVGKIQSAHANISASCKTAVVSTYAGSTARTAGSTNSTQATSATFNHPAAVVRDGRGNIFVADNINGKIRKIDASGAVTDFAAVTSPTGLALDSAGNVYVTSISATNSTTTSTLLKFNASGSSSTLLANLNNPAGVAVDSNGNVYVADTGNHVILKISSGGTSVVWAGQSGTSGQLEGSGTAAKFSMPKGLAVDASGNVYVADSFNSAIRKITSNGTVSTLAGPSDQSTGFIDGNGTSARFTYPEAVAVGADGSVYVADTSNNAVRIITTGGSVTTLAGQGNGIYDLVDGAPAGAKFNSPKGIAVDADDNVYIGDTTNNAIRKIAFQ